MKYAVFLAASLTLSCHIAALDHTVDSDTRQRVLETVITHLEQDYVDPEVGARAAGDLRSDLKTHQFAKYQRAEAFADALSDRLQSLTGDGHLNVDYSPTPIDKTVASHQEYSTEQMQHWYGAHINYGVNRIERLEGNFGYLDLRVFPPLEMGGDTIAAAMNVLADLDGLVIDLRENGGGIGEAADLVASYLFDGGRQPLSGIYDRPTDTLTQRFTQAYVPGKRLGGNKPVYVLISSKTFSAAEALAYNLQALGRATIVGEVSGGGAHPFEYLPIDPHFVLWSVTARSINPITGGNWQSVGVQPDILVSADKALHVALEHARREMAGAGGS